MADKTLRGLLKQKEALEKEILAALVREHPIGSHVSWTHGAHWQTGEVLEHYDSSWQGGMLSAKNINTGKCKSFTASAIVWYADKTS